MLKSFFVKFRIYFVVFLVVVSGCKTSENISEVTNTFPDNQYPKNIILMIGDGMGLTQITAAMYTSKRPLNLERFPVIGFHKTHSSSDLKTDSAAGATAFACGIKTFNGAIGVDNDTLPCKTILEEAKEQGFAVGLVATASITHATPAAFIAHQTMRVMYESIANDFMKTDIDLIIGGGQRYFDYRETDGQDLIAIMRRNGYIVRSYMDGDLGNFKLDYAKKFAYFSSNREPLSVAMGRTYLPYASRIAPAFLSQRSEEGFFLMIEGSQIDWAGHANEGNLLVQEILDFDQAIKEVLNFAMQDKETLVIVTADHETGGLTLNGKPKLKSLEMVFTTNDHTAAMVPVFAYGPKAELFAGIYDNTAIYEKMRIALQLSGKKPNTKDSAMKP